MAYNLPLQLLIQPPTQANLSSIRRQIESSLKGLNVDIVDPKNFAKTNAAIQKTSKQLDRGRQSANQFWDTLEGKARGAVAYTIVNTALLKLTSTVSQATREALKYETELLKISQVTGDSVKATREYSATLVDVSKKYNVALSKVAQLTRTLTQTGLSFKEAAKGADILAKTSLLATFDSLTSTTEGLIAVMQTFNLTVQQAGDVLEKINAVSKQFAVESSDIVEAIRRTGGAFGSAGGQVEELIALFTSVRSTSRESAETIATGFRTIFGRLQRPKTIEYFKQLGIQLETAEGQFIGPLNAIREISEGLERLNIAAGSTRFAEVVEQIGGIRQISRVVPLLEEFEKTQRAIDIQNNAGAQSTEDLAKAQQGLAFQLGQLNKEFGAFISDVVNSPSFKFLADVFINTSRAVLGLVSSLKPLLPILATVAAFKIGRGISTLLSGGLKGATKSLGFASGGMVPGSGNGDTVPAMLTPGEFVIRKSAVQAFGADRLAGINKYKLGGPVQGTGKELKALYPSLDKKISDSDNFSANVDTVELKKRQGKNSKFSEKTEEVIQGMVASTKGMMWQRFEDGVAEAFDLTLIGGNNYLDYPNKPGDAKFIPADATYEKYDDKKGNTNKTFLAKLVASGLYEQGIKKVTSYYPEDPAQIAAVVKSYKQGSVPKFAKGGTAGGEAEKPQKEFGKILLSEDATGIEAKYAANENRVGFVRTKLWKDNLYTVGLSKASRGYGPKLYDVAMEAITARGGMLTSDRATVSGDARKVWDFYFRNRSDVKKKPLPRDQWTGNYALVDEKLRGPQETWPPATDPAWALQTGYSKSPSLINDPNTVQRVKGQQSSAAMALNYFSRFANGGSVNTGTDTVPALLTPGEFVINKKSAQSFGYNNLKNINRYADGGFVTMDGSMGDAARATAMAKNPFASMSGSMGAAAQKTTAAMDGFADKLKEASKITEEAAKNTEETSKKTKVSFLEMLFGIQSAASALKIFGGLDLNQAALTAGQVQAGQYNILSDALKKVNKEGMKDFSRGLFNAGKNAQNFGKELAGKGGLKGLLGQGVAKGGGLLAGLGVEMAKYAPMIIKGVTMLASAFNIASWVSLIGGFADALFSVDYKKLKESAIESGNVEAAGENAAKQYTQELYRGVPIIGGFLAALTPLMPAFMKQLDANGKLVVATAKLQATMTGFDSKMKAVTNDLENSLLRGNAQEIQAALKEQRNLINNLKDQAEGIGDNIKETQEFRAQRNEEMSGLTGFDPSGSITSWWRGEHKNIIAAYDEQGAAFQKISEQEIERINSVSSQMQTSALRIVASGGSIGDAFDYLNQVFGADNVEDIFGSVEPSLQGLEDAYKRQKAAGEALRGDGEGGLGELKNQLAEAEEAAQDYVFWQTAETLEKVAEIKAQIEKKKGEIDENEARKAALVSMAAQLNRQIALNKEREIEAAAMERQIKIARKITEVFDRLSKTSSSLADAENVMDIMSGDQRRMTRQQALDISGITNAGVSSGTMRMSGQQILRDDQAFNEILEGVRRLETAQGSGGIFEDFLTRGRADMAAVQGLEGLLDKDTIKSIVGDALGREASSQSGEEGQVRTEADVDTAGTAIQKELIKRLGDAGLLDPTNVSKPLNAALLEYGKLLASGVSSTEAVEKIKNQLGEQQAQFIDEFNNKYGEVIEAEEKLREMQIALADRRAEEAKKMYQLTIRTYDAEREYFEKRFDLARDTEDFLNPVAEAGPNRARQLSIRAQERRGVQMGALNERRRGAGIGEDTGEAILDLEDELDLLNLNAEEAGHQLEMLGIKGNELIKTISEEISIEKEHMESLKEVALAQQAYQQELNDAKGSITKELVFGTDEQRADTLNTLNASAFAASQGSLAGIPEDMRAGVEQTLDKFANVVIPGLGMTGRQAQARIATNELIQMGVDPASAAQRAREMVQAKVPIDEKMAQQIENQEKVLMDLYEKEKAAQDLMIEHEKQMIEREMLQTDIFAQSIVAFREAIDQLRADLGLIDQDRAGAAGPPVSRRPGTELPPLTPQWGADMESRFGDLPATAPGVNAPPNGGGQRPPNAPNGGVGAGGGAGGVGGSGQAGNQQQIPIEINVQGQQDITVRIPDIQALANGVITAMVYGKIEETFGRIAESARSANLQNFEDLIQIFENGSTSRESSQSSSGGGGG